MKRILSMALLALMALSNASAGEVNYFNKSWEEIKAKAAKEHKYIMIDCYTDWCGWCKVMDKETMSDDAVIAVIHENFVAVKMDMEHGEGVKLALKYHVSGFPSFLFFNPDGTYVYQAVGYQKKNEFIKLMKDALDKTKQISATGYSKSINIAYPEMYIKAHAENGKRAFPKTEEVIAYLDKQKNMFSEESWAVLADFEAGEKHTKFFFDNIEKYRKLYGRVSVNDKLNSVLGSKLNKAIKEQDPKEFAALLEMIDKYMGEDAAASVIYCSIAYYKGTKEWGNYAVAANEFILKNGYDNTSYINTICWDIYENCDDKILINKACTWMKEVTKKEPDYAYLDTYASLLYKSGQMQDAATIATNAIEVGKKAGTDVTATEELLKKINEKK